MKTKNTETVSGRSGNPRFVWNIGAISESYPDMAEVQGTVLWDRQDNRPVVTLHPEYANAFCLETTTEAAAMPLTTLEQWFNGLSDEALESEGLTPTGRG